MSYSLYLWHWPLVVLLPYVSGSHLGRLDKVTIIVASFALAAATERFVEDPFRRPAGIARSSNRSRSRQSP